jgi:DNA-binding XRE family transcriptional regulator
MTDKKQSLRRLRASLGITQVRLADAAGLAEPTIISVEKRTSRPRMTTAYAIVNALNGFLRKAGRDEITIDSLDWIIQGENEN